MVERVFVMTLLFSFALLFAFLTRRVWFSLAASTGLFALIWISGYLKFSYLEVPAIAPDLYYFMTLDTAMVIARYLRGETLIEAYWKSVGWPGQGVFIGEPLAAPFRSR